jgi:purine-binding chemotaxis protein CheW
MQVELSAPEKSGGEELDATSPAGDEATIDAGLIEYISFAIGAEHYGVDIMAVREIKGWAGVMHLPKQPDYVRGVMNLRGVMVPIVDLRCRFGHGVTETSPLHVAIIVQVGQNVVGLLADRVLDIVAVEKAGIQAVPTVGRTSGTNFLSGLITVGEEMIALIDLQNLMRSHGGEMLPEAAGIAA